MATRLNTTGNNRARELVSLSNSGSKRPGSRGMENTNNGIDVLEFEHGVRAYPPSKPGAYWRLRWEEEHRRRETTAKGRADAVAKATEIVERLASGVGSEVANARGCVLVAHYLDPRRQPTRVKEWSDRMLKIGYKSITIAGFAVMAFGFVMLSNFHRQTPQFWLYLDLALIGMGLGLIPTTDAVHALARECGERSRLWWRELEVLLVAYSGLRWGEHAALTAGQVDPERRRITVDRQVVETRCELRESLPKGRRRR